jgi:hypothetical protein
MIKTTASYSLITKKKKINTILPFSLNIQNCDKNKKQKQNWTQYKKKKTKKINKIC